MASYKHTVLTLLLLTLSILAHAQDFDDNANPEDLYAPPQDIFSDENAPAAKTPPVSPREPIPHVKDLTSQALRALKKSFKKGDPAYVVLFYNPWDEVSSHFVPVLKEVALGLSEYSNAVVIGKYDTSTDEAFTDEHDVHGYPTFVMFTHGVDFEHYQGSYEPQNVIDHIKDVLKL
eukprot:PhF_6_TR40948/c0_g1_i1/m.61969